MADVNVRLKIRRDTTTNWSANNPILLSGEVGYDQTKNQFKLGNGSTDWNSLAYYSNHSELSLSLPSNGWSNNTQTISAAGVTATNRVIVGPAAASITEYINHKVYCTAQGSGTLTFTAGTTPNTDLALAVSID